ncbi:MAG: toprim domain-containing protein [Planctomycetales bacterium]|nr:toprim domain-containing protein [Planctomycetales bacterium]
MDRESELDAFKQINLSLIASAHGYEIDRKKSTRHSVLMASGGDKIIIAQQGRHYVYCSVFDPSSAGTAIDFVQRVVEPGCSLGRVRQLLRPYLGGGQLANFQQQQQGRYQSDISASEPDLLGVAARLSRFETIETPHPYLCEARGIPFELLVSPRLDGRIRHCPRRGSIVFPHWGTAAAFESLAEAPTGYEIKGRGVNLFSKGGRKGLWASAGSPGDRVLAVAESGLDAVSYLAARGEEGTRVCSISGQMNPQQPALIQAAMEQLGHGAQVVPAFDNDAAGDVLTVKLEELVTGLARPDLQFRDDRPPTRGADWNQVVVEDAIKCGRINGSGMHFGR